MKIKCKQTKNQNLLAGVLGCVVCGAVALNVSRGVSHMPTLFLERMTNEKSLYIVFCAEKVATHLLRKILRLKRAKSFI